MNQYTQDALFGDSDVQTEGYAQPEPSDTPAEAPVDEHRAEAA